MSFGFSKALVTGAAGFVGANLVRALLGDGVETHAVVREPADSWRLAGLGDGLHVHVADLMSADELTSVLEPINADVVFHLVSCGPLGYSEVDIVQANLIGTLNLLGALSQTDYRRLVYTGTSLEYGPKSEAITELALPAPTTMFGVAKGAASLLCQQHARANDRGITILRPFMVYGPWDKPRRFIPQLITAALRRSKIKITDQAFCRDWIFVDDVVEALCLAASSELSPGDIFNIGTGEQHSNFEVVKILSEVVGYPIDVGVGEFAARDFDTAIWVSDSSKAKEKFGWQATTPLAEGLAKTLDWQRSYFSE